MNGHACRMKAILFLCIFLFIIPAAFIYGADEGTQSISLFSMRVSPDVNIPLGTDAALFPFGAGAMLSATYRLPPMPMVFVGGETGYLFFMTNNPTTSLSTVTLGAQAGVHFQLSEIFSARIFGDGGGFLVTLNESGSPVQFNPYAGAGFSIGWDLTRDLTLHAGAGYRQYFGLLGGVSAGLGLSYQIPTGGPGSAGLPKGYAPINNDGRGLKLYGIKLDNVFPVFFKYYDDHPIGAAILRNYESVPAEDLKVFLEVKQYMDNPKECKVPVSVKAGENGEVTLFGLFTDKILEVAEATKLSVNISVEYKQYGKTAKDTSIQTLSVLDRNALTWSDDRKAAAFISAKDPQVLTFSKGVMVSVKDAIKKGVTPNIQTAIAIHQALLQDGITYVDDPASALTTNKKEVVDFIQYPQQTLGFRAGKCSDLTVLYCSLLESIGVATALITVPGHILMAFDLEMNQAEAMQVFFNPDDLIYIDGNAWLPIETTLRTGNFMDAWTEGIRQWRIGTEQKTAAFYRVRDAWESYNPVVFSGKTQSVTIPDARKISKSFSDTLSLFIDRQLGSRVSALQSQIKSSGSNPVYVNRLGLLYARFGQYAKAEEQFKAVLDKQETLYPLINIGNVHYLQGEYADALSYYNRALKKAPNDPNALLAVTRTNVILQKFELAKSSFEKLKSVNPELATRNSFLGSGSASGVRAADVQKAKGEVTWQE